MAGDIIAPTVTSIVRDEATPTNAAVVHYTVTFSEDVTGVGAASFALTTTGAIAGASITGVTPIDGSQYSVTLNTGTGDGTLELDVTGSGIKDLAGNGLTGLNIQPQTIFAAPAGSNPVSVVVGD